MANGRQHIVDRRRLTTLRYRCGASGVASKNMSVTQGPERPIVHARQARAQDGVELRAWRNDPDSRRMFRNVAEVTATEHSMWLTDVLADPSRLLVIGDDESGRSIGSVRFDPWGSVAAAAFEVSITVAPEARGKGYSASLLIEAENCAARILGARELWANIRSDNWLSIRLFELCGYTSSPIESDFGSWWRKDLPASAAAPR